MIKGNPKGRGHVVPGLICVVVALLFNGRVLAGQPKPDSERHLFWVQLCDFAHLGSVVHDGIKQEVSTVFSRAGVSIIWFEEVDEVPFKTPPFLARIYILESFPKGLKRLFSRHNRQPLATVLGKSTEGPGPLIYVSKHSIMERFREGRGDAHTPSLQEPVLLVVRSFGRVLAHELAHRFLRTSEHTERGILKPVLRGRDLVNPDSKDFLLSTEQGQRLRAVAARDYQEAPFASLLTGLGTASVKVAPTTPIASARR
jgi:hypothetical protein